MSTPARIHKYEIVRPLASGGMGTVYLARDPELQRNVAVKVIREVVTDAEILARFGREARAAAALRHVNIVTIYEVGQQDQQPFIAMEYVAGESLAEIIRTRKPLRLSVKLGYLEQVCAGLHFAHRAGVIHRDVKPANLIVDAEGVIRVVDFGIARVSDASAMTRDGALIGTLNYMSPEQLRGDPIDHRTDVFAVGAVAYELLSYQQAFPGTFSDGLLHRLSNADPPGLTSIVPGMDPEIEEIVQRALRKRSQDRYADLGDVRSALRSVRLRIEAAGDPLLDLTTSTLVEPPSAARPTERREYLQRRARLIELHVETARAAYDRGDFETAVQACEDAVVLDPDHPPAVAMLERTRAALQAKQERDREIRKRLADAEVRAGQNNSDAAVKLLRGVLTLDPGNGRARALLARIEGGPDTFSSDAPTLLPGADVVAVTPESDLSVASTMVATPTSEAAPSAAGRRPAVSKAAYLAAAVLIAALVGGVTYLLRDKRSGAPDTSATAPAITTPPPVAALNLPGPDGPAPSAAPAPAGAATMEADLEFVRRLLATGRLSEAFTRLKMVPQNPVSAELAGGAARQAFERLERSRGGATAREVEQQAAAELRNARSLSDAAAAALKRRQYVDAGERALAAAAAFDGAVEIAAARTAKSAAPDVPATGAAAAPGAGAQPVAPVPAPRLESLPIPAAGIAPVTPPREMPPRDSTPRPPAPDPAAAPALAAAKPTLLERERPAILDVLERYRAAYARKSVDALVGIYPTIPREERQQIERAFRDRNCKELEIAFSTPTVFVDETDPSKAQVRVNSQHACIPATGQRPPQTRTQDVFELRKDGERWQIENIVSVNR